MIGIFLDTEANGLDFSINRCIEIALKLVNLDSKELIASYESIIYQDANIWAKSDPASLKVNGFSYDIVEKGKKESDVSKDIIELFLKHQIHRTNAIYICQNPSFDRAFFAQIVSSKVQEENLWPYHWLDLASMFWALSLNGKFKDVKNPFDVGLSKNKIAKYLKLDEEKMPHKAMRGVDHLMECYFKLNPSY